MEKTITMSKAEYDSMMAKIEKLKDENHKLEQGGVKVVEYPVYEFISSSYMFPHHLGHQNRDVLNSYESAKQFADEKTSRFFEGLIDKCKRDEINYRKLKEAEKFRPKMIWWRTVTIVMGAVFALSILIGVTQ